MSPQPTPLLGKLALITGASRGIGAATALHLSSLGAKVVINYSTSAALADALVRKIGSSNAIAIQADASSLPSISRLVDETLAWGGTGKIDILIANAAEGATGNALDTTSEEDFDRVVGLNVKGPFFLVQKAAPYMPPGSHILLFSSSLTRFSLVSPNYLLYIATKGAIEQMTRVLARDLGRKGVLVNAVGPGPTGTELFRKGKSEELIGAIEGWSPMGRLGGVEDVVRTVEALVGGNTWVTGQVVFCNGGMAV